MTATTTLCDRCQVMAAVAYRKPGSPPWDWCRHHAREVDTVLRGRGYSRQSIEAMAVSG